MSEFPEQIYRHATYSTLMKSREVGTRYRLEGVKCLDCGSKWFPRRPVCPKCNSRRLEVYQPPRRGKIVSYYVHMVLAATLMGYQELEPRVVGIVQLDDGLNVFAEIIETPESALRDGLPVEMVFRKHRRESNSNWMYGYKFKAIAAEVKTK
jgi:2-acetylphloroglucinol acetyltransferase